MCACPLRVRGPPGGTAAARCSTEPAADVGVWSVTMGDLTDPLLDGSTASPYVDVPLEVEVSDWGDVSELVISVIATGRHAERWWNYQGDYGYYTTWPGPGASNDSGGAAPVGSGSVRRCGASEHR